MWTRQFKRTGERQGLLPERRVRGAWTPALGTPGAQQPGLRGEVGSGQGTWTHLIPAPPTSGETRRILSVQPTYDWTCFSHSLLNVSPMPVESSPPLPCPTPCHLLPNCTSCLDSKGADGGWQHCVWSSSLQQVPHPAGGAGGPPRPATFTFLTTAASAPVLLHLLRSAPTVTLALPSHFLSPHLSSFFVLFFFLFWPCHGTCGVLVPQPGIQLVPTAVKAQSPNHWTTREVPESHCSSVFRDLSLCPKPW